MGDDEVDDGEEGEVALLGLTSTSFFSFRSTCLLFVPESESKENQCGMHRVSIKSTRKKPRNLQRMEVQQDTQT